MLVAVGEAEQVKLVDVVGSVQTYAADDITIWFKGNPSWIVDESNKTPGVVKDNVKVAVAPWAVADLETLVEVKVPGVSVEIVLKLRLPVPILSVAEALVSNNFLKIAFYLFFLNMKWIFNYKFK